MVVEILAHDLKTYIASDNKLIHIILESLNCHSIREYSQEIRCGMPNRQNKTAVSIKKDSLSVSVYTNEETYRGDIYTLVMKIKDYTFFNATKYIHKVLGLRFTREYKKEEKKVNPISVFTKILNKTHNEQELRHYNSSILNKYINLPNIWFLKENITPETQIKFNIGFCSDRNRITIPHRFWNGDENDYIGIMGRTILEDYDIIGIPKYFPLIPFPKSLNLYGLQENYSDIQDKGIVCVFEGEKSVLKMDSFGYGFSVAIGGHEISKEQISILLSLDVEICICLDTDIKEDFIKEQCDKFKMFRKTSYIYDKYDLLGKKMSPVDRGRKRFDYLLKYRVIL